MWSTNQYRQGLQSQELKSNKNLIKKYNVSTITKKKKHLVRDPDKELYTFKTLHVCYILLTYA